MITGILLIASGILIAIYPPLLSIIVSLFLILLGTLVLILSREYRRFSKRSELTSIDLIFRY